MAKIRVLLADDNDETRDRTRRLLEYEDDIEIIDFAENGLVAIDKTKALRPDVILMDINMPIMDGLTATQRLSEEAPRSQIIIVSVQDDPNYLRQAMLAGACDYITKPIGSDSLSEAIRRAYARIPAEPVGGPAAGVSAQAPAGVGYDRGYGPSRDGHVIAVLGPKGGIGKTTISVNLGIGLAKAAPDKKTIVLDGNLYFGDVGVFLNIRGQYSIVDMATLVEVPEEIDQETVDRIIIPHESGVHLLVAPANPGEASPVSIQMMTGLLTYLKKHYDFIILDTATGFDDIVATAIQTADRIVMVSAATMPALKDTRIMFGELGGAQFDMQQLMLVLNYVDKTTRITNEQIAGFLGQPVVCEIPREPMADEAVNRGIALVTQDARRLASVQPLQSLVNLVIESVAETQAEDQYAEQPQQRRGGLFRR